MTTQFKLDTDVFGVKKINHDLLAQAYRSYLANGRKNLAVTKTRGMVRGGGKKPWRQKGTGRARVGSSRTPLWVGGGIVFGPTGQENYTQKLNLKAKRAAIRQALSILNSENKIRIIEDIQLKQPKTRVLNELLSKIGVDGYTLIVVDQVDKELKLAAANLTNVLVVNAKYLNIARLIDADTLVITKSATDTITEWLKEDRKLKKSL
jgi:large subunit ribosomal protein L4